jgi:hypothetical protein
MTNARELASRLLDLLRREHAAMADFLVDLAAFDERRLWAELGYASLFHFLHRDLGMSKGAAHYRKTAAELIQRVPEVVEPLRDGRICITSIIELAKVMTPENRHEVLPRFFNCSRQEAKAVSAELCPAEAAPHRTVVTTFAIPARAEVVRASAEGVQPVEPSPVERPSPTLQGPPVAASRASLDPAAVQPVAPRTVAEPLTADLRRLHVTVSKRFMEKLDAARDALSHSHAGADAEAILEAGLDLVIERAARRKGIVATPRTRNAPSLSPTSTDVGERGETRDPPADAKGPGDLLRKDRAQSRHISAAVKREVWLRDGGRCQARLENGELCGSTHRLQFDHIRPVALGGESTASNIRLACAPHNLLAARRVFGDALMNRYAETRNAGAASEAR